MATVLDVIAAALKDLGVLAAGETATAADAQDCLDGLNRLLDQWAVERLSMFVVTRSTWTLVSGTQTYTVGVGGTVNIARPEYIEHVHFQDTLVSPVLEYPQMSPLTDDAWAKLQQRTLPSPFPAAWYYDYAFPLANLSLWPVPNRSGLQGVIYAATATAQFTTLTQSIGLPPGYWRALVKNLAVEMAPAFDRASALEGQGGPGLLVRQAIEAKDAIKRGNKRLMDMSIDPGALVQGGGGSYDINTGN